MVNTVTVKANYFGDNYTCIPRSEFPLLSCATGTLHITGIGTGLEISFQARAIYRSE